MGFACRACHRSLFAVMATLPQGLMSSLSIEGMKIRRIKC